MKEKAAEMAERCLGSFQENPAGIYATLQVLADAKAGKNIHVSTQYTDALRDTDGRFVQLWAESLGKQRGKRFVGPTPLAAVGATDQHSQVQLFMEGPADKTVTFVALPAREKFFFSSRRRHTRWPRDWSSDVCSSD